jgi:lipoprotein-anchoring transpeptidase ErfK/SrfK
VQDYLESQVEAYELTIVHHSGEKEVITGDEISLEYVATQTAKELMEQQQAFLWPVNTLKKSEYTLEAQAIYNEESLQAKIAGLEAVTVEQTPPSNAYPRFDGTWYVIEPEVLGTQIQVEVLQAAVVEAVETLATEVNLSDAGCYVMPTYTSKSGEVQEACNALNDYLVASITYNVGEQVVIDRTLIQTWLVVDEAMNVSLNQQAIRDWLTAFGNTYDTVGTTRGLTTPTGKVTQVSGGTYGWAIDEDAEFAVIVQAIQNGEQIVKEPTYAKTAAAHSPQDWGDTYIEVDLSQQYMWYISNGSVVMESDVVTGLPTYARMTPQGVYDILSMQMHATLIGDIVPETGEPEYRQPVDYWMSVTWSGIGFHDAVWQSAFGGDLYLTVGSHGCINLPYGKAQELYSLISVGTPVVMHY